MNLGTVRVRPRIACGTEAGGAGPIGSAAQAKTRSSETMIPTAWRTPDSPTLPTSLSHKVSRFASLARNKRTLGRGLAFPARTGVLKCLREHIGTPQRRAGTKDRSGLAAVFERPSGCIKSGTKLSLFLYFPAQSGSNPCRFWSHSPSPPALRCDGMLRNATFPRGFPIRKEERRRV